MRNVRIKNCGEKFVSAEYDRYLKLSDTEKGDVASRFSSRKIQFCVVFRYNKQHGRKRGGNVRL